MQYISTLPPCICRAYNEKQNEAQWGKGGIRTKMSDGANIRLVLHTRALRDRPPARPHFGYWCEEGSALITHVIKSLKQQEEAVRSPILSARENIKNCPSWATLDMEFARDSQGVKSVGPSRPSSEKHWPCYFGQGYSNSFRLFFSSLESYTA